MFKALEPGTVSDELVHNTCAHSSIQYRVPDVSSAVQKSIEPLTYTNTPPAARQMYSNVLPQDQCGHAIVNIQPLVQQPLIQQPLIQEPVVQQPFVQQPFVQQPVVQQPLAQQQQPLMVEPEPPRPSHVSRIMQRVSEGIRNMSAIKIAAVIIVCYALWSFMKK